MPKFHQNYEKILVIVGALAELICTSMQDKISHTLSNKKAK